MSTDPSSPRDPREVQTFTMPEPPAPLPEEPGSKRTSTSSANAWVIVIFLVALAGVFGFWKLYLVPKTEAERVAAEAAVAHVRPWPERAEEAIRLTFEGAAGTALAASLVEVIAPGAAGANLDGMAITPVAPNIECLFTVSWKDPKGQPTGAQVRWVIGDELPVAATLVVPPGGPAATEEQTRGLAKILNSQAYQVVLRNTAEK